MQDEIAISDVDSDAIYILPLSMIPLKSQGLKRARLVKNSRLESMVELFSGEKSGSGQIPILDLPQKFNCTGEKISDLVIINKLAGLASYDVFSLRVELRRLRINVENVDYLKLSPAMVAELSTHMQAFTKPLLLAIYGSGPEEPFGLHQLLKSISDPEEDAARERLLDIVERLRIDLNMLPDFLEHYGDVYLSLAYYQHCLDRNSPVLERIYGTIAEIRSNVQLGSDVSLCKSCDFVESKLKAVAGDVKYILDMFKTRTSGMWEDISADKFDANKKLVLDYQAKIGGALCVLTVKSDAWEGKFPIGDAGGIFQRANFIANELRQGLESVDEMAYDDSTATVV